MTDDLSKSLLKLRNSTNELNELTDRANALVRRAERYLSEECRVGGPVHVEVPSMDQPNENFGPDWSTYLGYERYKGEHRIVVTHAVDGDPHEIKAWAECSRDIKLKSIEALPDLVQMLLEKVNEQVAQIHEKLCLLEGMIPSEDDPKVHSSGGKG